ncbi:unnamed protein product [Calypogeia fissa]
MASNYGDWKEALKAENCVRVKKLLEGQKEQKDKNELLQNGWEEEEAPEADGSVWVGNLLKNLDHFLKTGSKENVEGSLNSKRQRVWKGRTALHVAARRGDAELVQQIRDILHPDGKCSTPCNLPSHPDGKCSTLCHLLEVIDSDYELDALAMAVVNGSQRIVTLLKEFSRECQLNAYHVSDGTANKGLIPVKGRENEAGLSTKMVDELKKITKEVLPKSPVYDAITRTYEQDCDFNFLDMNLYFFHFTFSSWMSDGTLDAELQEMRKTIVSKANEVKDLLRWLLIDLWDGQGRSPLHVAVDSNKVSEFLSCLTEFLNCLLLQEFERKSGDHDHDMLMEMILRSDHDRLMEMILNAPDNAGRKPLYRAAALSQLEALECLLADSRVNLNAKSRCHRGLGIDLDELSWRNNFKSDSVYITQEKLREKGFDNKSNTQGIVVTPVEKVSSTALHVAIILKHEDIVNCILKKVLKTKIWDDKGCQRRFTWPVGAAWKGNIATLNVSLVSTMKLAVLVGSTPIVQKLLEARETKPGIFIDASDEEDLPSFHLAAAMGDPGIIKAFLDSEKGPTREKFDPRVLDCFGNTALHHALSGQRVKFHPHLVDFVSCLHVFSCRSRWETDESRDAWISEWLANPKGRAGMRRLPEQDDNVGQKDASGQRRGAINLLLEAGLVIWDKNQAKRTASPLPNASEEFVTWWFKRVADETQQVRNTINAAANAVLVTAALVATASYVGPLTPPLGYDAADAMQVNILAVRIFVVCDSLSFYFALATIMFALFPSLPLQDEPVLKELLQTKVAVTFLFPSIAFVLAAFTAGYIAVIPTHGMGHHGLIVTSTVAGGLLCLCVMIKFLRRLVKANKKQLARFSTQEKKVTRTFIQLVGQLCMGVAQVAQRAWA